MAYNPDRSESITLKTVAEDIGGKSDFCQEGLRRQKTPEDPIFLPQENIVKAKDIYNFKKTAHKDSSCKSSESVPTVKNKRIDYFEKLRGYVDTFKATVRLLMKTIPPCIAEMTRIAEELDEFHKGATIASVTGSSVGIAGGITTIASLALAPVTLGASLVVSGVGLAAAVVGGVSGAVASIADNIHIKNKCNRIQEIVNKISEMMKTLKEVSDYIHSEVLNLRRSIGDELFDVTRVLGRSALAALELSRITQLGKLSAVASQGAQLAIKGFRTITAISGVLSALFVIIDAVIVVKGAIDLHNGSKTEEAAKIRECAKELQIIHEDLQEVDSSNCYDLSLF